MSLMPQSRIQPGPFGGNLAQVLASIAAREMPQQSPPLMPPQATQGMGPLSQVLMGAVQGVPMPQPVPRQQSASPAVGGIAPPDTSGGESVNRGMGGAGPISGDVPVNRNLDDDFTGLPRFDVAPQMPAAPPGGDDSANPKISKGQLIAGILGDMLAGAAGRPATFAPMMERRREMEWQDRREERKLNRPHFQNVPGVGLVAANPADMTARTVMGAKSPAEVYAEAQGFVPGSPEYSSALSDFALKSAGPTAFGYRSQLQDDAQESRVQMLMETLGVRREVAQLMAGTSRENNIRSNSTSAANNMRSTATSAANNQRTTAQSDTNSQRQTETTRGSATYKGKAGAGGKPEGTIIVNPSTGQKMIKRGGQWVPHN